MGYPSWSFLTDGGITITGPASTASWAGSMVASGTATVSFTDQYGEPQSLSSYINVPRRTMSWASAVQGATGQPGEIDVCIQENWDGLTASKFCTSSSDAEQYFNPRVASLSSGNGLTVAQVGTSGPNAGLYYISQMTASMQLRTQISPRYRVVGTQYSLAFAPSALTTACAAASVYGAASVYQANAICTNNLPAFNNLVSCIWSHEARHMSAGVGTAQYGPNDVYVRWEPLVRSNATSLVADAREEYDTVHELVAGSMQAAENAGPPTYFPGWWKIFNLGWSNQNYFQYC